MRLDSPKVKRAAGWIGAFALPVAIVQIAGWMSGSPGPAQASATDAAQAHAVSPAEDALRRIAIDTGARRRFSPAELAAAERIERLRAERFGPTPMLHAQPHVAAPQTQATEVLDPTDETPIPGGPVPEFHLQAVMSGSGASKARALINGKVVTVGEAVPGTGWTILSVAADERRVVLEHTGSGRTVILTLKSPN